MLLTHTVHTVFFLPHHRCDVSTFRPLRGADDITSWREHADPYVHEPKANLGAKNKSVDEKADNLKGGHGGAYLACTKVMMMKYSPWKAVIAQRAWCMRTAMPACRLGEAEGLDRSGIPQATSKTSPTAWSSGPQKKAESRINAQCVPGNRKELPMSQYAEAAVRPSASRTRTGISSHHGAQKDCPASGSVCRLMTCGRLERVSCSGVSACAAGTAIPRLGKKQQSGRTSVLFAVLCMRLE